MATLPTSGMAATARLTPTLNMSRTGLPWMQPTAMMTAMTTREAADSYGKYSIGKGSACINL